jgi:hypothetical protein
MQRIMKATGVDISIIKTKPPKILITATGEVTTTGWTNPSLEPWFYLLAPEDGIQDFDFVAEPPTGPAGEKITPIAAQLLVDLDPDNYWGEGKPLRGVRIHSRSKETIEGTIGKDGPRLLEGGDLHPWPWSRLREAQLNANTLDSPIRDLLGRFARVYHTGDPITMDWRPDRANIELDASNFIARVWFG